MDQATTDIRGELQARFGFADFRPGQESAVRAALAGRDTLVVMPTGSGKSICYQLPALMRDDLTLVVSPLVSLMQDQVESLSAAAGDRVARIDSSQGAAANRDVLERAAAGHLRLLYVAPERFGSAPFLERIRAARVGLFVVDEAHCVSQWGHDFRPDYFRLADAARWLGAQAMVALTATATPQVADDVVRRLGLRDPVRVSTGFDRPNLSFLVVPCATRADKHRRIAAALAEPGALPALVYAGTRAGAEAMAERLSADLGEEAVPYHAGLGTERRAAAQRRFMAGDVRLVVATNAFGMGVDKADVRTVVHETVPGSLEAYYQEAGRAGRDGLPSRCLLFAEPRDKGLHVFFIQRGRVEEEDCARVAARLDGRYEVSLSDLPGGEEKARAILGVLARGGVIRPAPSGPDRASGRVVAPYDGRARAACRALAGEAERVRWRQFRAVWRFVEERDCRRQSILRHFGDHRDPAPSGACCDVCAPDALPAAPAPVRPAAVSGGPAPVDLDEAILDVVAGAEPAVGRTRAVEILRGGRSKVIARYSYDGMPAYGAFAHLAGGEVLARVDGLLGTGRLRSTGGRFPKLEVTAG